MYPVCLNIRNQLCIVVGGGAVAERKVLSLLKAKARVRIVSPQLTETLTRLATEEQIEWLDRGYQPDDIIEAFLVFAATDSREVQKAIVRDAVRADILINTADSPEQSGFHVPAVVRQGDLTLAVSTNGTSPALAARIRKQLEKTYGPEYAVFLNLMAQIREQLLNGENTDCADRKILFQNMLHDDILQWIKDGRKELLEKHLHKVFGPGANFDFFEDLIRSDR